jgi:hypothetical protein
MFKGDTWKNVPPHSFSKSSLAAIMAPTPAPTLYILSGAVGTPFSDESLPAANDAPDNTATIVKPAKTFFMIRFLL